MTTNPIPSTTDDLIAEIENGCSACDGQGGVPVQVCCGCPDGFECCGVPDIDLEPCQRCDGTGSVTPDGEAIKTLIARIRELEARTVTLPPPYPMPEPDENAIDDSHMDPYWAANGMRSAFSSIIKHAGIKVIDPYMPDPPP